MVEIPWLMPLELGPAWSTKHEIIRNPIYGSKYASAFSHCHAKWPKDDINCIINRFYHYALVQTCLFLVKRWNQMSFSSKPSKYKSWPANTHKMELFRQLLPNTHQSTLFVGKIARKLPICVSLKTAIFPFNIGKNRIYMNLPSLLISWTIRGLGSHLIPHLLWFQWLRIWHLSRILAPARFSKLEPGKFLESMRKLYLQWIFIRKKKHTTWADFHPGSAKCIPITHGSGTSQHPVIPDQSNLESQADNHNKKIQLFAVTSIVYINNCLSSIKQKLRPFRSHSPLSLPMIHWQKPDGKTPFP